MEYLSIRESGAVHLRPDVLNHLTEFGMATQIRKSATRRKYLFCLLAFALVALLTLGAASAAVMAQEHTQWSPQDHIPGYDPLTKSPYLVADQNRTVHAFNSVWIEDLKVIMYSQWTIENGWTEPIDILLPQLKAEARLKGAVLDHAGTVHLMFFSGDEVEANVYYSAAPLAHAGRASAWSKPKVIGSQARTPDEAAMVMDSKNRLFVLYSGDLDGVGLYFTYSTDGGNSWSEPTLMFLTYLDGLFPYQLKMYVDKKDSVHAIWNVNNESGRAEALYYAKLEAGQREWNEPIQLETGILNEPSITEYQGELFIIQHTVTSVARHMRRSFDGGQTWTEPVQLFPHIGTNGPASIVVDSNNVMHMFFGNRLNREGEAALHGLWHSVWQGASWSFPEAVVSGVAITDDTRGKGFDPADARAVVSQGNVVLVTWDTDPAQGVNGAWYSYTVLDAPELPVVTLPIPTPTPMPSPTATATPLAPTPTASPKPVPIDQDDEVLGKSAINHPATPLILGTVPVALLIATAIIVRITHHSG
jgi:hypothetical protein